MGYLIEQTGQNFCMLRSKQDAALKALQEWAGTFDRKSWIWSADVKLAGNMHEALESCRWVSVLNDAEDITMLNFCGEKSGCDLEVFVVIAPYVEDGSYIEMRGEDGEMWRWVFKNGKCSSIYATVTWEEN